MIKDAFKEIDKLEKLSEIRNVIQKIIIIADIIGGLIFISYLSYIFYNPNVKISLHLFILVACITGTPAIIDTILYVLIKLKIKKFKKLLEENKTNE